MTTSILKKASLSITSVVLTLALAVGLVVPVSAVTGVNITSLEDGAVLDRRTSVVIAAETSPEIVPVSIAVDIDGVEICSGGGSDSISCEWQVPSKKGAYTISVVATDTLGNVHTDAVTVTVECYLQTVNEGAEGENAEIVTVCLPVLPEVAQ